jgi:hypothetical protein
MTAADLDRLLGEKALAARPGRMRALGIGLALVGLVVFIIALLGGNADRAWHAYHLNFVFFTAFAQASIVFAATQKITRGRWAGVLIRFSEAAVAFLPVSIVLFVGTFFAREYIFTWIHEPRADLGQWLTVPWVFGRDIVVLVFLTWLSIRFVRADLRPDLFALREGAAPKQQRWYDWVLAGWSSEPDSLARNHHRLNALAPGVIVAYAFGYSILAIDLVMSLSPHWYSNLYPAFFFMGAVLTAFTGLALLMLYWRRHLAIEALISKKQFHDLGKLCFGFTVFWAYLMFAQFLVIWYGNLPEETWFVFYRLWGEWRPIGGLVFALVFLVPFVGLLGKKPKTIPFTLGLFATISIAGMWLEKYLLITPSVNHGAGPAIGLVEVGVTAGYLGIFLLAYAWFAGTFPMLSPRLARLALAAEAH